MKLRIKADSLRLRVGPSEVERLLQAGRVEETIHFAPQEGARLTYALESSADAASISLRYAAQEVVVMVPASVARSWADGAEVGIYGKSPISGGELEIVVEKDWGCLDKSDAENEDTFPNPKKGAVC